MTISCFSGFSLSSLTKVINLSSIDRSSFSTIVSIGWSDTSYIGIASEK